jgi:membrane protein implicated in regulation of membrane protease activity
VLDTTRATVESVIVIVAVGASLHYLAGFDWPWAVLIGAGVSVALRWLLRSGMRMRPRKPPLSGGG